MKQFFTRFTAYTDVLRPTATGVIVAVIMATTNLFIHQVHSFQHYLNVPTNWHVGSAFLVLVNNLLLKLLGTNRVDTVVLSIFWVLVGMVVYIFLKAAIAFFVEMGEDIVESGHYLQPQNRGRQKELSQLIKNGLFRLVVLIITVFYFVWMLTFFSRNSISSTTAIGQWLVTFPAIQAGILFILQCLCWGVLTILLRLIWMRNRLFG